jgi:hypothetical protein
MEWSSIISIIMAILVAIVLPLVLRKRKKEGSLRRDELYQHLKSLGIDASLVEKGDDREKIGLGRTSGQKSEGIIKVADKNIDSINIASVSSQYGTHYFADYLVHSPNTIGNRTLKKTRLNRKKSSPFRGKVVAIEWKGDESLARSLNLDYSLEERLLSSLNDFKGNIWILPEPKHGYTRIRTDYSLPSIELFQALSIISRYIKSW